MKEKYIGKSRPRFLEFGKIYEIYNIHGDLKYIPKTQNSPLQV